MAVKQVFAPHLNRIVKFGRKQPTSTKKHLKFSAYARKSFLPAAPALGDYRPSARAVLRDIYGNDILGDCVIAAGYHVEGTATGNAGDLFHATQKQIVTDYSNIGGYVPGDESTDNGCDEDTALTYWVGNGFANGTKLIGYLAIDAANYAEVCQALYLFENNFFGVGLPDAWISPFPSDDTAVWDVAGDADPNNGHAFCGVAWGPDGVIVDTWGLFVRITPKAIAKYASASQGGQLFVLLTPDVIAKGQAKAPNGLDWASLVADFNAMGGSAPMPAPAPVPAPPAPVPPSPIPAPAVVTLDQAQTWAVAGLAKANPTQRPKLTKAVKASLAANWPK